jgi:hypothetical protein
MELHGFFNGGCLRKLRTVYLLIFFNFDCQVKQNRAMLASNPVRDNLIVTEYFDKGFQIWLPLYFIPELEMP